MICWLSQTLIVTGMLIALVLVIRRPVSRMFGPGLAYALWAIPLVRLVLPPLLLPGVRAAPEPILLLETYAGEAGPVSARAGAAPAVPTFDMLPVLIELAPWLWLAGALAFVAWRRVTYLRMRERLLCGARPMGEAGRVRIVESPSVTVPVAFGVLDPVIALPPQFLASPDRRARDLALAHELEHHAAHDLAANMAMQALLALHWFNPLAWIGWRAMRRDQEAACDARVVAGRDVAVRAEYARLIAAFAGGPRLALAAPMAAPFGLGALLGEKSVIHRLRTLSLPMPSLARRRAGNGLICAALLALPLTATVSYASAEQPLPTPPEAPEAKKADRKVVRQVTVIRRDGDKREEREALDESKLETRTVERDGKTIVLRSDHPFTDEELEKHLERLDDELEARTEALADRADALAEHAQRRAEAAKGEWHRERFVVRMPDIPRIDVDIPRIRVLRHSDLCASPTSAVAEAEDGGARQRQVVTLRVCHEQAGKAHAIAAIKSARDGIARDTEMLGTVRQRLLEQLDQEIARLSKDG